MSCVSLGDCGRSELKALERVNYFPRQLLGVDEMVTERDYFLQKLRRHNLFLHGWGVVCGLEVTAAPTDGAPWRVRVSPGYALGPYGDEINVAQAVFLDLASCGPGVATDPCEPGRLVGGAGATGDVFVAIKYAECFARPVRALSAGCGCEEEDCQYSRIRDSYQVECLTEPPPRPEPAPSLCELINLGQPFPCPPCATEPWVVLAKVALPASPATALVAAAIDNMSFRRQIYSTAVLQEQLIKCCCKPHEEPPPAPSLLKVKAVRILSVLHPREDPKGAATQLAVMDDSTTVPPLSHSDTPNAIEVTFVGSPLEETTVKVGTTFRVMKQNIEYGGSLFAIAPDIIRWVAKEGILMPGDYLVTLVGTGSPAIASKSGQPLDGEPIQLPSGDGVGGGNFQFRLSVQRIG